MNIPIVTVGLKETTSLSYVYSLKDVLRHHFYLEPGDCRLEIEKLDGLRQNCVAPHRSSEGVNDLFTYHNQLFFIDRRFFPLAESSQESFVWYDSLTGMKHSHSSIDFEKSSILFNIAALYSQLAALEIGGSTKSLYSMCESLKSSAGAFIHLQQNTFNTTSVDMLPDSLLSFSKIMLAQARECELRLMLVHDADIQDSHLLKTLIFAGKGDVPRYIELSQECSMATSQFDSAIDSIANCSLLMNFPPLGFSILCCKRDYYAALANWFMAQALLAARQADTSGESRNRSDTHLLCFSSAYMKVNMIQTDVYSEQLIHDFEGRKTLAKAHLRRCVLYCEEALKVIRSYQRLDSVHRSIKSFHDRALEHFASLEEEDDFTELLMAPNIRSKSKKLVEEIEPDFSSYKVEDIFSQLGPLSVFSAQCRWTKPRTVVMTKSGDQGFGFSLSGDCPAIIADVDELGLAQKAGLRTGDFVVAVDDEDVKWAKHQQVVSKIRKLGNNVRLQIVTPIDYNNDTTDSERMNRAEYSSRTLDSNRSNDFNDNYSEENSSLSSTMNRSSNAQRDRQEESVVFSPPIGKSFDRPTSFSWKLRKRRSRSREKFDSLRRKLNVVKIN